MEILIGVIVFIILVTLYFTRFNTDLKKTTKGGGGYDKDKEPEDKNNTRIV